MQTFRYSLFMPALLFLATVAGGAEAAAQGGNTLSDLSDSASYMVGFRFGNSLVEQNAQLNHAILLAGVVDGLRPGSEGLISSEALSGAAMKADSIERSIAARMQGGDSAFDPHALLYGPVSNNGPTSIGTWNDTISYIVGFSYGANLSQRGYDTEPEAFALGMNDRVSGLQPRIDEQGELLIQLALQEKRAEQEAARGDEQSAYAAADAEYMAGVAASAETKRLGSGILYQVTKQGGGVQPEAGKKLVLHIVSSFVGEEPYFNSRESNKPIVLAADEVAPFLSEAIELMSIGSVFRIFIPAEIGFANAPPDLPRRVMIYDVELAGVQD